MKITFGGSAVTGGILSSMAVLFCLPSMAFADSILGSAQSFAVLGASTVTNTGTTTISGSLGVYPGFASTGGPAVINGSIHAGDAVALQAQNDERHAYNTLAALAFTTNESGVDLGGKTLLAGVYKFTSDAFLTGIQPLTLDFQGISNSLFVFQITSALHVGEASVVKVTNGSDTNGIFWLVGSSATLNANASFAGNILALDSVALLTGAKIECGRAFAQTGGVTMQSNLISGNCSVDNFESGRSDFGSAGFSPTSSLQVPVPEPGTFLPFGISLSLGLVGLALKCSARKK